MLRSFICLLLIFFFIFHTTPQNSSYCSERCKASDEFKCITEHQYYLCADPISILFCPDGFCNTSPDAVSPCTTLAPAVQCSICESCNLNSQFACVSEVSYRKCDENGNLTGRDLRCGSGKYCDALSRNADDPCTRFASSELLCWVNKLNLFCGKMGKNGRYPHPDSSLGCTM